MYVYVHIAQRKLLESRYLVAKQITKTRQFHSYVPGTDEKLVCNIFSKVTECAVASVYKKLFFLKQKSTANYKNVVL